MRETQPGDLPRGSRVIDMKLPLPWLLSTAVAICMSIGGMYFKLDHVGAELVELKATVKAGNVVGTQTQEGLAILRWRVDQLERGKTP